MNNIQTTIVTCIIMGSIAGAFSGLFGGLLVRKRVKELAPDQPCPRCHEVSPNKASQVMTLKQICYGGWTCPKCRCDVDRDGNERGK